MKKEQIIDDCYSIRNENFKAKTIGELWWSLSLYTDGKYCYNPFEKSSYNSYLCGKTYYWLNQVTEANLFTKETIVDKELLKYSEGFKDGYFLFERDYIKKIVSKKSVVNIITSLSTFEMPTITIKTKDGNKLLPKNWREFGKTIGRYYCAWCIVLKNQGDFEHIFIKILNPQKEDISQVKIQEEKYNTQIFKSLEASLFFEALLKDFESELKTSPLSYLSFIYWSMSRDKMLFDIKPIIFRNFLNKEPYSYELEKLKTLAACNTKEKERRYKARKSSFHLS